MMKHIPLPLVSLLLGLFLFNPAPVTAAEDIDGLNGSLNKAGLHTEPWFNETTGDFSRDLQAAKTQGKMLAIFWEQPGCEYCRRMHKVNFKVEKTVNFIRKHFYVVLVNMRGDREVTDFDGSQKTESELASAHRVTGTPTVEFRDSETKEVFRMPGYANDPLFTAVFEYVASKGYEEASLETWYRANVLNAQQIGG